MLVGLGGRNYYAVIRETRGATYVEHPTSIQVCDSDSMCPSVRPCEVTRLCLSSQLSMGLSRYKPSDIRGRFLLTLGVAPGWAAGKGGC